MGLDTLLDNQLGHLPKFHIHSLSTTGVEIELIFTLVSSGFWDTGRFSKVPYLGMKLGY